MSRILKQYKHVLFIIYIFLHYYFSVKKVYEVLLREKQAFSSHSNTHIFHDFDI